MLRNIAAITQSNVKRLMAYSSTLRDATEKTGLTYAPGLNMTLAGAIAFTLLIGIYPDPFIAMARHAVILGF